jgi:hypothetical protein
MLVTKKYIFHYDAKQADWSSHTKYLKHDGKECTAFVFDDEKLETLDMVHIVFEDGFPANAYPYELEEIK